VAHDLEPFLDVRRTPKISADVQPQHENTLRTDFRNHPIDEIGSATLSPVPLQPPTDGRYAKSVPPGVTRIATGFRTARATLDGRQRPDMNRAAELAVALHQQRRLSAHRISFPIEEQELE